MKKLSMVAAAVLGLLSFAGTASAATPKCRQHNEQVRINQGVRSGELNRREAARLEAQHMKIRHDMKVARRDDGRIDRGERARIEREQDRLSHRIYEQKHDGQRR